MYFTSFCKETYLLSFLNFCYFYFQKVDGKKFLSLQQKDLMALANNKFGPVLKVENLLGLLKARMDPAQARFLSTIRKS